MSEHRLTEVLADLFGLPLLEPRVADIDRGLLVAHEPATSAGMRVDSGISGRRARHRRLCRSTGRDAPHGRRADVRRQRRARDRTAFAGARGTRRIRTRSARQRCPDRAHRDADRGRPDTRRAGKRHERHPHRAAAVRPAGTVPPRRRHGRAPHDRSRPRHGHRQPHQGPGWRRHCRTPPTPGWPDQVRRPADRRDCRRPRLVLRDDPRREGRAPAAEQEDRADRASTTSAWGRACSSASSPTRSKCRPEWSSSPGRPGRARRRRCTAPWIT